jgi:mannose-6-phosphate isomerase-like protein (cupin superfamily)
VIHHFRPSLQELPLVVGSRYVGDSTSRYKTTYASGDGALKLGFWDFRGAHTTPLHEGYEEVLVLLAGTLSVECEGRTYAVAAGDVVVYDCPIPPQALSSADGVSAAYVMRHRP